MEMVLNKHLKLQTLFLHYHYIVFSRGIDEFLFLLNNTNSFCRFYPGSGSSTSIGTGRGENFTANIPLPRKTDDKTFLTAFHRSANAVLQSFQPDCIVLQCGCDGLANDPLGWCCYIYIDVYF